MPEPRTPCVIYAAKSTQDKHKSIPDQIRDGQRKADEEGWEVVGVGRKYADENFSAYSGNRGPGLVRAQELAAEAAAERGVPCMLVAQHSDRFARGAGDAPGASDSLVEIWSRMRRRDVHLRSFQNDSMLGDVVLVAVASKQAHEESERKSQAVRGGKRRRAAERGQPNGPLNFGYQLEESGRETRRVVNPEQAPGWLRARAMLGEGKSMGEAARWLNRNGYRTKNGKELAPRRVRDMLANPYYAGKVKTPDGELVDGDHDGLISWDEHLEIVRELDAIWKPATRRPGRRSPDPTLLCGGLLRCAHCGEGVWQRKHESGRRDHLCGAVRQARGTCDAAPFDAPAAEAAVLEHLDGLFVDLGSWIARLNEGREEGRRTVEAEAAGLMREREGLERDEALVRADYMRRLRAGDEAAAGVAAGEAERIAAERASIDAALRDAEARLAEWDGGGGADEVLDWWTEFSEAIRGNVLGARTVAEANAALRERFAAVFVHSRPGGTPRLDFVLADRPPGSPVVSSRLWVDSELPDDGAGLIDFVSTGDAGNNESQTLVRDQWVISPISA